MDIVRLFISMSVTRRIVVHLTYNVKEDFVSYLVKGMEIVLEGHHASLEYVSFIFHVMVVNILNVHLDIIALIHNVFPNCPVLKRRIVQMT